MHRALGLLTLYHLVRLSTATVLLATLLPLAANPAAPTASADQAAGGLPTCAPDVDFLGFSDALDKTTFERFSVAELSGLTYDPPRQVYYTVADRAGPVQSHVFTLQVPLGAASLGVPSILAVLVLQSAEGVPYTGLTFDGEGIALTPRRELLVASEGGSTAGEDPEIRRFSRQGHELGALEVDPRFFIPPDTPPVQGQGTTNLTFESLALSPNGRSLFTANERPLSGDGQTVDARNRIRIQRYEDRGPGGSNGPSSSFT